MKQGFGFEPHERFAWQLTQLPLPVQTWSRCDHCRSRERCNLVKNAA